MIVKVTRQQAAALKELVGEVRQAESRLNAALAVLLAGRVPAGSPVLNVMEDGTIEVLDAPVD